MSEGGFLKRVHEIVPQWLQVVVAVVAAVFFVANLSSETAANTADIKDLKAKVDPQAADIAAIKQAVLDTQGTVNTINRRFDRTIGK